MDNKIKTTYFIALETKGKLDGVPGRYNTLHAACHTLMKHDGESYILEASTLDFLRKYEA